MTSPGGGFNLATVYVQVLPSMRGFSPALAGQAGQAGSQAGEQSGSRFSSAFKGAIKGAGAVVAGALAAGAGLAGLGLKSAASLETTTTAFTSLLGSTKAATTQIAELQKYAAQTPFEQQDVLGIAQQFYTLAGSVGLSKDQVIPFLDAVGNLGAVTGASVPDMQNAVRAIGQIGSSGKVTLDNLNQISEAFPGFNGAAAIASATGMTTAQTLDAISKGTIDAKTGVQALLVGMQQFPGAAGAMKAQAQTLNGVLSTFTDTIKIQLTNAFTPLIPVVKTTLTQLTPIIATTLQGVAPVISSFVANIAPVLGPLVQGLGTVIAAVFKAIGPAIQAITPVIKPLANAFAQLITAVSPLITLVGQIIGQLGPPLLNLFSQLAIALTPVVQAFANALTPVLPVIAQALRALGAALIPVATIMAGALQTAITAIAPVLPLLAKAFGEIVVALTPVVVLLAQGFATVVKAIAPSIPTLATALISVAKAFANILVAISPLIPIVARLVAKFFTEVVVKLVVDLAGAFVQILNAIAPLIPPLIQLATTILPPLIPIFKAIIDLALLLLKPLIKVLDAISDFTNFVNTSTGVDGAQAAFDAVKNGAGGARGNVQGLTGDLNVLTGAILNAAGAAGEFNANGIPVSAADATQGIPKSGPGSAPKTTPKKPAFTPKPYTPTPTPDTSTKSKPPPFDKSTLSSFLQTATGATTNPLDAALKSIIDSAKNAGYKFSSKAIAVLKANNKQLKSLVAQRDKIATDLQNAQTKLQAAQEQYNTQKSTVQTAVLGSFDIAKSGTGFDGQQPVTINNILAQLKQTVARASRFSTLLRNLRKQGLSKVLVSQLAAAGPDALPQAEALAKATPAQLAQVNSGYSRLGREASGLGTFIANDMFKAGVDSAQGVINGLKARQKNVITAIKDLGAEMVRALRKALKIKSPSRVMFGIGQYTGAGFEQGIASKYADVRNAGTKLGNSAIPGVGASGIAPGSAVGDFASRQELAAMMAAWEKRQTVVVADKRELARAVTSGQAQLDRPR